MPEHKQLPQRGMSKLIIFQILKAFKMFDVKWKSGRVFGYVYATEPDVDRVAKRAFMEFLSENGLDPTAFPSLLRLENEVVSMVADHLHAPPTAAGSVSTGGTESIFLAMKTAREYARSKGIHAPEIVVPNTAHAAFHKAAHLLNMHLVVVPVNAQTYKADVEAMRAAINENTIILVGSAVSYAHGVMDPISELSELALERNLLLHVDACIGGWVLPYWRRLGAPVPPFDFILPGVTSVSLDLHKYGFCPKPCSTVIYRTAELRAFQLFACSGWAGYTIVNNTFLSSKSGGPLAGAWATMHYLGDAGYMKLMRSMYRATQECVEGIPAIPGLRLVGRPEANLLCVASDTVDVFHVADEMKTRGWYIQPQLSFEESPKNFHISIIPSAEKSAARLLVDLRASVEAARKLPSGAFRAYVEKHLEGVTTITPEIREDLMKLVGVSKTQLPDRMFGINETLDTMTPQMREQVMKMFVNDLYQHDEVIARAESAEFMAMQKKKLRGKLLNLIIIVLISVFVLRRIRG